MNGRYKGIITMLKKHILKNKKIAICILVIVLIFSNSVKKWIASRIHSELVWMCVLTTEYCEIGERYQINLEKGRTYPLKRNALFIKMWYDYFALAIRENVKMVSTRVGIFHASRCWSIMIA